MRTFCFRILDVYRNYGIVRPIIVIILIHALHGNQTYEKIQCIFAISLKTKQYNPALEGVSWTIIL